MSIRTTMARWLVVALVAVSALAGCSKGSGAGSTPKTTNPSNSEHGLGPAGRAGTTPEPTPS